MILSLLWQSSSSVIVTKQIGILCLTYELEFPQTVRAKEESVKVNQTRMCRAQPNNTNSDTMQLRPVPLATHHQSAPWGQQRSMWFFRWDFSTQYHSLWLFLKEIFKDACKALCLNPEHKTLSLHRKAYLLRILFICFWLCWSLLLQAGFL